MDSNQPQSLGQPPLAPQEPVQPQMPQSGQPVVVPGGQPAVVPGGQGSYVGPQQGEQQYFDPQGISPQAAPAPPQPVIVPGQGQVGVAPETQNLLNNQPPQPNPQGPGVPGANGLNTGQFDFIVNPKQQPKKTLIPKQGKGRILFMIGIVSVVLIVVIMLGSLLFGGGGGGASTQLLSVAQKQTEIVRIAGIGVEKAGSPEARKLAVMSRLIVLTDQQELLAYMTKSDIKYKSKDLAAEFSSKTTQDLENAEANGRFDALFIQTMTAKLDDYQKTMQTAYNSSENKKTKDLLAEDITEVTDILGTETADATTN